MNKVSILGVKFDAITKQEAVQRAMDVIRQGKKAMSSHRTQKLCTWHAAIHS